MYLFKQDDHNINKLFLKDYYILLIVNIFIESSIYFNNSLEFKLFICLKCYLIMLKQNSIGFKSGSYGMLNITY